MKTDEQVVEYMELRNYCNEAQHVWHKESDQRYTIHPSSVAIFPVDIAKLFLEQRGRYVGIKKEISIPELPGEPKGWIANMTGDPRAPAEIVNSKGVRVPNPNKEGMLLSWKWRPDQTSWKNADGYLVVQNHPRKLIELPAYQRVQFPLRIIQWIISRDARSDLPGKVMHCDDPLDFEPNDTWDYDRMRAYADMVSDGKIDVLSKYKPSGSLTKLEVSKLKLALLQELHFYICDPKVSKPDRETFYAMENTVFEKIKGSARSRAAA